MAAEEVGLNAQGCRQRRMSVHDEVTSGSRPSFSPQPLEFHPSQWHHVPGAPHMSAHHQEAHALIWEGRQAAEVSAARLVFGGVEGEGR